jgi:hypothetical protein
MTIKGWNTDPVACHVVGLNHVYYIMTQHIQCKATGSSDGCGKSMNLYDPSILDQLEPGLAASFPAFLTHRSGIDKTLLTMIRLGIAHCLSASSWSKIMCELNVCEHDICEVQYLYAIQKEKKMAAQFDIAEKSYIPFSEFKDKDGYAGFYPSCWYINNVYMDYMEHIRPILDQCMAALTGYVIKWDHSFKLSKYLMKLDGVVTFAALFTLVNEIEQIRYQAFVPTKSLSHIQAGLEAMVKSLKDHGLAEPVSDSLILLLVMLGHLCNAFHHWQKMPPQCNWMNLLQLYTRIFQRKHVSQNGVHQPFQLIRYSMLHLMPGLHFRSGMC